MFIILNSKIIKNISSFILDPLTLLFNTGIEAGTSPDPLKIVKLIHIFRKGDNLLPKNYRLISILPHLEKIFEIISKTMLDSFSMSQYLNSS